MYPVIGYAGKEWVENPKSLYVTGSIGSGKTYFCFALLRELLEQRECHWVIFVRSCDLDDELLNACETGRESYCLEKYKTVPFLFIDDLGVERTTDRVIKQYYNIIDFRVSNSLPTVFSSNLTPEDTSTTLGDRISSRLQVAKIIKFPKQDLRKQLV